MKKVAVIYEGRYGSTQQYASWICQETGGDLYRLSDVDEDTLQPYDTVVFGGAIHGGGILGIDKVKKLYPKIWDKQVLIFAVGLNTQDEEAREQCRELNFTKQEYALQKALTWVKGRWIPEAEVRFSKLPCWFFRGAYDPQKVSGMDKVIMGVVKGMIRRKRPSEVTPGEEELLEAVEHGADYTDRSSIAELVEEVNKVTRTDQNF